MLKENYSVDLAVINGVLRIGKEPHTTPEADLFLIRHYRYLDHHPFSASYELTQSGANALVTKFVETDKSGSVISESTIMATFNRESTRVFMVGHS